MIQVPQFCSRYGCISTPVGFVLFQRGQKKQYFCLECYEQSPFEPGAHPLIGLDSDFQ